MNILITGATGFIGRHLVPIISQDATNELLLVCRNVCKAKSLFNNAKCTILSCDQLESIISFNPHVVIHLASKVTSKNDTEIINELISANILFGVQLLNALKGCSNMKLFINIGTFAEYRFNSKQIDNAYLYSASKTAFRSFLDYYSSLSDYKYVHVIPYSIYGGQDTSKKVMDYIKDSFESDIPIQMTEGKQVLDFIHVDDIVSFFRYIIHHLDLFSLLENGETIHLGTGVGTSLKDLASMLELKFHHKANIQWGGIPYRERDIMYAVAPVNKLKILGWESQIPLSVGINE